MFNIAPLLLLFPIIGVVFNGFFGRNILKSDRQGGEALTGWFASLMSIASFVVGIILFLNLRNDPGPHLIYLFDWFNIPSAQFVIPWEMQIDTLSSVMILVITGVGSLIHIYAIGYMHGDENFSRFFTYLNLFLFFMLILVTGSSYLVLFVGWEGVGLCSFLLIGFWFAKDRVIRGMYEGDRNSSAARKAFVANRVGDLCMIVAMSLIFWAFGSMRFVDVFSRVTELATNADHGHFADITLIGTNITVSFPMLISLITVLLLLGAAGKSAQIPLFVWLPDAMAGPTPVSALMHAATMVTSGIYLIVRSNVLFEVARVTDYKLGGIISTPDLVALVGASTAVYAGLVAFTQFDIKKVLAYSTVSQLGFMIAAAGMGAYVAAMFHLVTHAFFKALLFMAAGSVIHGMEHGHHHLHGAHDAHGDEGHEEAHGHHAEPAHAVHHDAHGHEVHHAVHGDDAHGHEGHHDEHAHAPVHAKVAHHEPEDKFDPQDMRFMGNLRKHMPITSTVYIIGSLALAGIVPFAGFWSKDEILAHASANGSSGWIFQTVYWMLTIAAICTAFYMGRQLKMVFFGKERHEAAEHAHESPPVMTYPLIVLAILSLVGGLINFPHLTGEGESHTTTAETTAEHGEKVAEEGHGTTEEAHGATEEAHGTEGEEVSAEAHSKDSGYYLALEHWLEHSIASFELTKEGVVHMPHTPIVLQPAVAGISTVLAVASICIAFFVVYGKRPQKSDEKDPILSIPPFSIVRHLPLNTFYMSGLVPLFDKLAYFCGQILDWNIWHNFVHEKLIRDSYIAFSEFTSTVLDRGVVDRGLGLGLRDIVNGFSKFFGRVQTGYVRNYAFGLFIGVVALVLYFILI